RQLADSFSAAAQGSEEKDKTAFERLADLKNRVVKEQPGSNLAAYITYRDMQADYSSKLAKPSENVIKVQEQWVELLTKFIEAYPKAEDAPDALLQIGMVSEFLGKETAAKNAYQQMVKNYGDKKGLADKAQGALRRLELEGKKLELSGQTVGGGQFDTAKLHGKVVVVYYWASWNHKSADDFTRLKQLLGTYQSKGLEVVCVNLDGKSPESIGNAAPGVQLFHPDGQESPLATYYGIMVLPNLFLVDKEGKVVSRTVQISNLEEELKKLIK